MKNLELEHLCIEVSKNQSAVEGKEKENNLNNKQHVPE